MLLFGFFRFRNIWVSGFWYLIGGKEGAVAFFGIGEIPAKQTHILFIVNNCYFMNRLFF